MTTIFKRLRGAAVTVVSWSASWAIIGAFFRIVWPSEPGGGFPSLAMLLASGLGWVQIGAISGALFALLVMGGGRRRIEDLTMTHVAVCGAIAGVLLPFLMLTVGSMVSGDSFSWLLPQLPRYAIAGALCGAGSLALARRTDRTEADRSSLAEAGVTPATTG